jgi:hypothetical protein
MWGVIAKRCCKQFAVWDVKCNSEALLQAFRFWGCVGCDSEALLQAVRCFRDVGV